MRESLSRTTTSGGKERAISLHEGDLVDLTQRGLSCHHFFEGRFAKEHHSLFFRCFLDLRSWTAVENHGPDTIGEVEKFRDRGPSVETGAVAIDAAGAFPEHFSLVRHGLETRLDDERVGICHLVPAGVADLAHEPLPENAVERRYEG